MPRPKVAVVGSLNIDYIATVARLPGAGETVPATGLVQRFGGKGANQAVAAARQGADVHMIGCVGGDDGGRAYLKRLRCEGIRVSGVSTTNRGLTGTALIAVDDAAENLIVVAAGANGKLKPDLIRAHRTCIESAKALLLQQEIPMPALIEAVLIANRSAVPVMLNPSPLRDGFSWAKCRLNTLIANEGEAQAIFGLQTNRISARLSAWRRALTQMHIECLIITRGAKPTAYISAADYGEIQTLDVEPVDTVGAGDAFAGAFVARRAEGCDLLTAIRHANCAGALATLKPGAQEAIPKRAATEKAFHRLA